MAGFAPQTPVVVEMQLVVVFAVGVEIGSQFQISAAILGFAVEFGLPVVLGLVGKLGSCSCDQGEFGLFQVHDFQHIGS